MVLYITENDSASLLPKGLGDDSTCTGSSGVGWYLGCLGRANRRMPGAGPGELGMAVSRLLDGKGGFLGGAIGRNPTDRSKAGSKKSILVDGSGGSLSAVVAGANVHDTKLLRLTLESIAARRPEGAQNLCLDTCAWTRGMTIPPATKPPPTPDTRLILAVLAKRNWTSRAKKPSNYLGLLQLACALIWYRRRWSLANLT